MNVGFEDFSTADVAKMLKIDQTTVAGWCRDNKINFQNVSESGSNRARYLIPEYEAEYLRKLYKKYGKHKAMKHYDKNRVIFASEVTPTIDVEETLEIVEKEVPVKYPVSTEKVDDDKLLNSIIYIREVKERIEDCKAELNQLENEYMELRKEIIGWL